MDHPDQQQKTAKHPLRAILYRAGVALFAALAVFLVLYIAAWINCSDARTVCRRQSDTQTTLKRISREIKNFQARTDTLPDSLDDLVEPPRKLFMESSVYQIYYVPADDGTYKLYSLGRDGEAGGIGLDADLYHDGREGNLTKPTFTQFFLTQDSGEVDRGGFLLAASVAGGITFFTVIRALFDMAPINFLDSPSIAREQLFGIAILVVLACVVGVFLMPLHIPTGH